MAILAAIAGLALVSSCDFGGDDATGPGHDVTVKSEALISGCSVSVTYPTRVWVGSGDNGHYALTGTGYVSCSSGPHNFSATMTAYVNGWYYDSRSTTRWGTWGMTFNAYMACPGQGSGVQLGFSVTDLDSGASTTVYSGEYLWYPGC